MGNGKFSYAGVQVYEVINTQKAVNGGQRFKRTENKLAMSGRLVQLISWNIYGCGNPAKKNVDIIEKQSSRYCIGLVLYRVACQCRALAWPFIVINRKVCSAELEQYFVRWV